MAKATKSRTPGKGGSKPGAGGKTRKAATALPRAGGKAKAKVMTAAKAPAATKVKFAPGAKPAVSVAGAKMVGPAAVKKPARPAEDTAITESSREFGPAAAPRTEPVAPRASIEPPQAVEREGTPPALPVPIASFTF
jgi:hypothetical protein